MNQAKPVIMLVEDEPQQRETLTMMFEAEEYAVLSSPSAEGALNLLRGTIPDLVITDVKLTGMDGFTFFDRVRELYGEKRIPFIFITGYNDQEAIAEVQRHGALAYVTKPYDLEPFISLVKENVASRKKVLT